MDIHIFIDFDEKNNALLTIDLPIELIEVNEELYSELCHQPFYSEKGLKLNPENIQKELNNIIEIIKNNFTNKEIFDNTFNVSYSMDDDFQNKETIIEFLKQRNYYRIFKTKQRF